MRPRIAARIALGSLTSRGAAISECAASILVVYDVTAKPLGTVQRE
jgi:hypothetical protein